MHSNLVPSEDRIFTWIEEIFTRGIRRPTDDRSDYVDCRCDTGARDSIYRGLSTRAQGEVISSDSY